MNIDRNDVLELLKKQIEDQGCTGDSFDSLSLLQPHLFEWITFFGFTEEDLKCYKQKKKLRKKLKII